MPPLAEVPPLQKFWFLSVADNDIRLARQAALLAIERSRAIAERAWATDLAYGAVHDAAIVRYCRPFTGCELPGGGRTRLPAAEFARHEGIPREFHQRLMDIRNEVVAHSDLGTKEVVVVRLPAEDGAFRWNLLSSGEIFDPHGMNALRVQCDAVLGVIRERLGPLLRQHGDALNVGGQINLRDVFAAPGEAPR